MDAISHIAARALERGPRCGNLTVIAIDGPAGSGKTTLAARLASELSGDRLVQVLGMDDLYPGWGGLREAGAIVEGLLLTLSQGEIATYRRYDWHAGDYREQHEVWPDGLLIVEGVGSVRRTYLELLSLVVVVREPDSSERLRRGLARDGVDQREHWLAWMDDERKLHHEVGLAEIADVVVDGYGRLVS